MKLNASTLPHLPAQVLRPAYNRSMLLPHTVHLGVGSFHRAHQALYLDDLLAVSDTERWGECGIGVLPSDDRMRDILHAQNCLYTVLERSAYVQTARVVASLTDYLHAPTQRDAAIERMSSPHTRILSLTITEGGYFINDTTGQFLATHPDILQDLQHPRDPITSIGLIAAALDLRRTRGLPPFTVMSCDNLQGNGHVIRRVLLAYTALSNSALHRWIDQNVAFPNSMVDRITPATTPADIVFLAQRFGLEDAWPVVCEPFRQWVIEDDFPHGRPRWELLPPHANIQLIADVLPYELMKMRLLNGSHVAMAYLGAIAGLTFVHDILGDPIFAAFIAAFMEQVTPVIPPIPGVDLNQYKLTVLERFANPTINDQVTRICSEGSAKIPKWLVPSINELLALHAPTHLFGLVLASWIVYLAQDCDQVGHPIQKTDARASELAALARASELAPAAFLAEESLFGAVLAQTPSFVQTVFTYVQDLQHQGVHATLRKALSL